MKMDKYEAGQILTGFRGHLAEKYHYQKMKDLYSALDDMIRRYGMIFIAEEIRKDRDNAELALFRYMERMQTEEPEAKVIRCRSKVTTDRMPRRERKILFWCRKLNLKYVFGAFGIIAGMIAVTGIIEVSVNLLFGRM